MHACRSTLEDPTLGALHARHVTGRGQRVETSLYQGVMALTTMLWVHAEHNNDQVNGIMSKTYPPGIHQAEVMQTSNGWVQALPMATQKRGATVQALFGLPADTPFDKIFDALREAVKERTREEVVDLMHGDLFQCAELIPTRETFKMEQVIFNEMAISVDDPEVGPTTQTGIPFRLSLHPPVPARPRPAVGAHNDEVFAEHRDRPSFAPGAGAADHRHPLAGIRVLDFGRAFAGPFGPMLMAQLGADVIKVATPESDPGTQMMSMSSVLMGCEQGKRSILVDLKTPQGQDIIRRLVEESDVVHHNLVKGVAARLGIDHATLVTIKPDIISCNAFMYGPEGPLSHLGGNDSLSQAFAGFEWEMGPVEEGNVPMYIRFGLTDGTNAMASVVGVLAALHHRDRTGEGQEVWSSLMNAALYSKGDVHLTQHGAANPPVMNKSQTGTGALHRLYDTQDGWIQVAGVRPHHWEPFCRAIGRQELLSDPRFETEALRHSNRTVLEGLLEPTFRTQTALQWRRRLDEVGVPAEISQNTWYGESVLFDEENVRLGIVSELDHPLVGRLRQVGQLMRFSDTPSIVQRPPLVRGDSTLEIVRWLGYEESEIEKYLEAGVIATG